ncbi:glutamate synthase [Asticcacaulis sp. AC460]|uniref:glutamate synthase large subunit n=1 Tax=Asticcacaulis sp. AC460 TaxID=1282360 RepID=UPI0003C3F0AC|nr:glutamate synthase large subunit [Asticcacaulis sp. AC460]ESQ93120.1 glutamate synthase [Asticcacaulis sp. AC460]
MTQFDSYKHYQDQRQRLIDGHAYDPASEISACGVGVVCAIDGQPRRDVVDLAVKALKALFHRGAVDADGKSGDGAGILLNVPQDFFREQVRNIGHTPRPGPVLVGQVFLPRSDLGAQESARTIVESEILRSGFYLYGWRQPPVDVSQLGSRAMSTRPEIEQIMMAAPDGLEGEALERAMFLCRRRIEKRVDEANLDCYLCSFSAKTLIYKGMFRAELVDDFYLDLKDPRFISSVAIFHQRFSTNTFPEWRLAQPFRMLAHNGEINTLRGNVNWMKSHEIRMAATTFGDQASDVKPVIQPRGSDSAALDNVFELLVRAGRSAPMTKALLIPEAVANDTTVSDSHKALYAYCNAVMEPWDGPAAICATDGRWVVAGKDRNGLRPLRVTETRDGLLIVGSEAGMTGVSEDRILRRIHIAPGRMIGVDLQEGKFFSENDIIEALASKHDYRGWLENMIELEPLIAPGPEPRAYDGEELRRRQIAAGFTLEDLDTVLDAMVKDGKEAIGSMGDDTPMAVLSEQWRPLAHFFRQSFAQVTNPPIDPLREAQGMSLKTRFKNLGNILAEDEAQTDVFVLESPFLTTLMYERMITFDTAGKVRKLDATFAADEVGGGKALTAALERLRDEAVKAVAEDKASMIVLTDEALGEGRIGVPAILAAAAVHSRLVQKGLRSFVSLVVRSSETMDPHAFAVLVGVGATAINPYLSLELLQERLAAGRYAGLDEHKAFLNYKKAIEAGLMKILAKKGISIISSYRGGYEFEALGLSRALVAEYFPGVTSRISGIGLSGIEQKLSELHAKAFGAKRPIVDIGGFYKMRAAGETHYYQPKLIHLLQEATTKKDYETFKRYSELVHKMSKTHPTAPRDLLNWQTKNAAVSIEEVESVNEIRKRFVTPGMSLGALSPEAHETLNIAMNRIGARSVSGEGGEDPERYNRRPNGDNPNSAIKQIASGRFGVTAEYLNQCREIEIKVAQGAKPGEGGQLPGFKVTEFIARMRHSTPGVGLISPPPHHDIYSIEDLAQLIYDLKQINPIARVTVKLVSQSGIGAVAAGVAKAKADAILVAGHVGGTGASPLSSVKFAGLPFELGLSEAHQVLTLNNLRGQIRLRADGGMRTGRDIVVAAMLGAEEFGIGTASLVAMGCLMVRQCQSNTCPVGVCVQDERLRAKFTGTPDKVVNLFTFIAEEVREILASLGLRSLEEAVGRTDMLHQVSRGGAHLDDLDLNPLLVKVEMDPTAPITPANERNAVADTLDAQIVRDAGPLLERGEKMELTHEVRNTMRAVGTRTSSELVRKFGNTLDEGHLTLDLRGSAGQSLGAFAVKGLTINLIGEANDYVGKGLSGATIVVRPKVWHDNQALAGNTILYGATSGQLFIAGAAGERFCVRNSGATAVVEGVGAHGCEYMTGGQVVILGKVGMNFGAGMTGGVAYIYDPDKTLAAYVNHEGVTLRAVPDKNAANLKALIAKHVAKTLSPRGQAILDDWEHSLAAFVEVMPNEILAIQQKLEKASA